MKKKEGKKGKEMTIIYEKNVKEGKKKKKN